MHPAFETWDIASESLESVENRIHDGVPREEIWTPQTCPRTDNG